MKQAGVGLCVAILIDATIVRAVLLPASMKLLGDRNWYLPEGATQFGRADLTPEAAEGLEQPGTELRREIVRRDRPRNLDRRAHLLQVVRAVRAAGEMRLERRPQGRVHGAFEIVGDDLDDLLAREVSGRQGSCVLQVLLERGPHFCAGPMEQHSLIRLGEPENVARLLGRQALDVAEGDHRPLVLGERRNRLLDRPARLAGEQALLRDTARRSSSRRRRG